MFLDQFVAIVVLFSMYRWLAPGGATSLAAPLSMPDDLTAVGAWILLATGFRIGGLKSFAVGNMLPALLLIMSFSALWQHES